jgi:hypothetical protein
MTAWTYFGKRWDFSAGKAENTKYGIRRKVMNNMTVYWFRFGHYGFIAYHHAA